MHSSSDELPSLGAFLAAQQRPRDAQCHSSQTKIPVVDLKKRSKVREKRPRPPPQVSLPRTSPSEGRRPRESSAEQDDPCPPRPRKRRKLRDSKGKSKQASSPIELTSSEEEPNYRIAIKPKAARKPRVSVPVDVIDLCSDPEDYSQTLNLTQNQPQREEDVIVLLTTDDEDVSRQPFVGSDQSTPSGHINSKTSRLRYVSPQIPPTTSTPNTMIATHVDTAAPPSFEAPMATSSFPSGSKEPENNKSGVEEVSGPLQALYNEALLMAPTSEQSHVACNAFLHSGQVLQPNTTVHHLGIFDPASFQPPLLTPNFFMQVQRCVVARRDSSASQAKDTVLSSVAPLKGSTSSIQSLEERPNTPAETLQPSPSCLTQLEMVSARESPETIALIEQSLPTKAGSPQAVARTLKDKKPPSPSPPDTNTIGDASEASKSPPYSGLSFHRGSTPLGQHSSHQAGTAYSTTTDMASPRDTPPTSPLPPSRNQVESHVLHVHKGFENHVDGTESDSPDDLEEILGMLMPEIEEDQGGTNEELFALELAYPEA